MAALFTSAFAIAEINALCGGINSPGKATAQNVVADAYMMKHIRSTAAAKASCITNGKGCRTAVIIQMRDSTPTMGGEVFAFAANADFIAVFSLGRSTAERINQIARRNGLCVLFQCPTH